MLLSGLILFQSYLGLLLFCFGPPYVEVALNVMLGPNSAYLTGPAVVVQVLKAYCALLPLLALNGVVEGFVQSVANERELDHMSRLMVLWCALFSASVFVVNQSGIGAEVGMVFSTGINMTCRIFYGAWFVRAYLARKRASVLSLAELLPPVPARLVFGFAAWVMRWSAGRLKAGFKIQYAERWMIVWPEVLTHVMIGVSCLVACGAVM